MKRTVRHTLRRVAALVMIICMIGGLAVVNVSAEEEQKTVYASTVKELEAALKSNTRIILEAKDYNVGSGLYIEGKTNLTIQGTEGTRILVSSGYDLVVNVYNSHAIILNDLTMGHDVSPNDGCEEGVLRVTNSDLALNRCDIFGCGKIGIYGYNAKILGWYTTIRDCSDGGIDLWSTTATFQNCVFSGNGGGFYNSLIELYSRSDETTFYTWFINCTFKNNKNTQFASTNGSVSFTVRGCTFSENRFPEPEQVPGQAPEQALPEQAPEQAPEQVPEQAPEYIYDTPDPGEDVKLPTDALNNVADPSSAAAAVKQMTDGMTSEQKSSPTGIDLATLYAETAVSRAASKSVDSGNISINAANVADLASEAAQAITAVETALSNGGITTARYLSKTVTFTTDETNISIQVDPDILTSQVDKLRVETTSYALTLNVGELKDDLTEPLTFKAQEVTTNYALRNNNDKATVKIDLPKAQMTNPVIVSLPKSSSDVTFQAVVKSEGSATSSKFNPATLTMDGRINTSGTYTVKTNEKSFTDISNKSAEMQKAILYLASKGIISGTSDTQFSPDNSINRQQIAALVMRALGKVDNTATTTFTDVATSSSLYHAIASSQRHGIINGYSDNTFRGANVISKSQIVTVSGRVLTSEMNYKAPANTSTYLGKYKDSVPEYAQEMVALATREGLVVYRTDGTFSGDKNMTRGDAAIILYRLFQKIW